MVFNVNGLKQVTGVCTMKSSESESLHNNLQLNGSQSQPQVLNLNFFHFKLHPATLNFNFNLNCLTTRSVQNC